MKKGVLILSIILILGLIFVAGCSTDSGNQGQQQQYYGGGGCGVNAPSSGDSSTELVETVDEQSDHL